MTAPFDIASGGYGPGDDWAAGLLATTREGILKKDDRLDALVYGRASGLLHTDFVGSRPKADI
jgi:hypothetical protein